MKDTVLWLLRHPEPEVPARGRCYGALELALSPRGERQAAEVASALAERQFAAIYTSPRLRCRVLAEMLARGRECPLETVDDLREMDFGEFEGRSYDELSAQYPALYRQWMEHPTETQFPGGESFGAMSARVRAASNALRTRHAGESIAIVTHGGVIRILLAEALGLPEAEMFRIGQRYAAVNAIRYFGDAPMVELVNGELRGTTRVEVESKNSYEDA